MDYWTGILEWTTGITYFWFLHILGGLIDFSLAKKSPIETSSPLKQEQENKHRPTSKDLTTILALYVFLTVLLLAEYSAVS